MQGTIICYQNLAASQRYVYSNSVYFTSLGGFNIDRLVGRIIIDTSPFLNLKTAKISKIEYFVNNPIESYKNNSGEPYGRPSGAPNTTVDLWLMFEGPKTNFVVGTKPVFTLSEATLKSGTPLPLSLYISDPINQGVSNRVPFNNLAYIAITGDLEGYAPYPPSYLSPSTPQDPLTEITLSWIFNSNPQYNGIMQQSGWELEYTPKGGTTQKIIQSGNVNQYTFPPSFFDVSEVTWRVRTKSSNEFSEWSGWSTSTLKLVNTPPNQPTLIFPLNVSISGLNGVPLEWRYSSDFDIAASRFDIRYSDDEGITWIEKTNTGQTSIQTEPIVTMEKVIWQVKAFGATGFPGDWSSIGTFFTQGLPDPPIIVRVSNSNRPTIYFSGENILSWELEIIKNDIVVYQTGNQVFLGEFLHKINTFLDNGNYLVRMRITSQFGSSDWGTLAFTINTISPEPLKLSIVDNPSFGIQLHFNNTKNIVYIYRSEFQRDNYFRIAVTKDNTFEDYTAKPKQRYKYFVRVIAENDSFADSNIETGLLNFLQTTIAEYINPSNMTMLIYSMDSKPTKDEEFDYETTFTNFIGRESPVSQMGTHSSLNQTYSFFCTLGQYAELKALRKSPYTLILRDWRLGVVYGKINGAIAASREINGCNVSFVFTQTDFIEEVDLI